MGHHVIAYSQSITSTAMAARNAVSDPSVRVQGVDILVPPGFDRIAYIYAQGPDLAQAQLQSPSLRRRWPFDISPIDTATTPAGPYARAVDLFARPIALDDGEQLEYFAANAAAGANIVRGVICLSDGKMDVPTGDIFTIRATGTTTLVAENWTNCALTLSNQLPFGNYAVVGARVAGTTVIAARLVFPGAVFARPGCLGVNAVTTKDDLRFRYGNSGTWGVFQSITPPTVDVFATAADTAQTVHLDLVKVA